MTKLKVFHNDFDWAIAEDLEDVAKVLTEHYGYVEEDKLTGFAELDLDEEFTMFFVDNCWADKPVESCYPKGIKLYFNDCEDEGPICWHATATYREWIDHNGRGFLGSTEW